MATAMNDFVQGIVMLVGIVTVIAAVLNTNGGLMASVHSLSQISDQTAGIKAGAFSSVFGPDPISLLGVIILTSLGTWGLPQMVQKFYAIQSENAIRKGTVISTVFALVISGGCYFLGSFGRLYAGRINVAKDGYDAIVPQMLSGLSPVLIGLVVILVLSASMSTLSALVMASSSTLTIDFIRELTDQNMEEKKQVRIIRILIIVFIVISVILAIVQYKQAITFIAQLMGVSWGALAGSFLAPFLYGLYWKRTTKTSIWCCFIFGSGLMICNLLFRPLFPKLLQSPINAGAFAMLAGLIIVPLVSILTAKPDQKEVDHIFSCYKKSVQKN